MRPKPQVAEAEAARALHRLAFAIWRAAFYLQRGPRSAGLSTAKQNKKAMVRV